MARLGSSRMQAGRSVARRIVGSAARLALGSIPGGGAIQAGMAVVGRRGRAAPKRGGGFVSVGQKGKVGLVGKDGQVRTMRTPSVAHIGKNLPRHRQIVRLRRNLKRHRADALTILQLTGGAPGARRGFRPRWRPRGQRRRR